VCFQPDDGFVLGLGGGGGHRKFWKVQFQSSDALLYRCASRSQAISEIGTLRVPGIR
jgi:hypothetical protein